MGGPHAGRARERVIDWRRLRAEALEPIATGGVATWHPFDFAIGHGLAPS